MTVGIIGLGLIGASFARSIKAKTSHKVYGYDKDSEVLLKASLIGAIDKPLDKNITKEVDLLVLSVYPRAVSSLLDEYLPYLKDGATVIDLCGIKREIASVMERKQKEYPAINFFACHPMAGREFTGIDHSMATLFERASSIVVPISNNIFKEEELKEFFLSLGFGSVVFTTAEEHDRIIAYTSELCHIVSNAYIKSPTATLHHGFSAGSYRDLTRVSRNNSALWSTLMIGNRDMLLEELNIFIDNLKEYQKALQNNDEKKLADLLEEGNKLKLEIDKRAKK